MIAAPALYSVSKETADALDRFVKEGGVLIGTFRSFAADRNLSIYPDQKPHGLTGCFGMMYQQFTEPGRMRVKGKQVRYLAELLQAKEAETLAFYEHKYWGSYSAVTKHAYGRGDQPSLPGGGRTFYRKGLPERGEDRADRLGCENTGRV